MSDKARNDRAIEATPEAIKDVFAAPLDPRTELSPHCYWEQVLSKKYESKRIGMRVSSDAASLPPDEHHLRFVCISDTHEKLGDLLASGPNAVPDGDVLIHCGDFTHYGDADAIAKFNEQMASLPHRHKIVVAGNHDLGFEDDEDLSQRSEKYRGRGTPHGYRLLADCTYLQDRVVDPFGKGVVRIYGASWHPLPGFSFYRPPGECIRREWEKIPPNEVDPTPIDILVTHTPPLGHLDVWTVKNEHEGCADLLECVEERVRPKFHVFGHLHEQNGLSTNGKTVFINATICDHALNVANKPVVFDYPLPEGVTRSNLFC